MNTCDTIDYKISIYPSIVHNPNEVILNARVFLPDNIVLCVQETIRRYELRILGDAGIERVSAVFASKLSEEIYRRIRYEAKQEIYKQNE